MSKGSKKANKRSQDVHDIVKDAQSRAATSVAFHREHAPAIEQNIIKVLVHKRFLSKAAAKEVAFHLTDWIADLAELNGLFAKDEWDAELAQRTLMTFVAHTPNHLAAAHRILYGEPVTDVFDLGAVKGSGRAKREPGAAYEKS